MRILFDQGTPVPLRRHLPEHEVATAAEMDWSQLTNGELLAAATAGGFAVLVTTDQNLRYQQNLENRTMAIVVSSGKSEPVITLRSESSSLLPPPSPADQNGSAASPGVASSSHEPMNGLGNSCRGESLPAAGFRERPSVVIRANPAFGRPDFSWS